MFDFNITMEQLLAIRKDCANILATHDASLKIAFSTKTLSFFEYMEGWEYEDLCPTDIVFHTIGVDAMVGEIISHIGEEIPETQEEANAKWDAFEAMTIIEWNSKNCVALTMESGTNWDQNKTGSFLIKHSPFYIRPYEGNKMEIVNSNGDWLLRTSRIVNGDDNGNYMYFMTASGHKYQFVPFEAR